MPEWKLSYVKWDINSHFRNGLSAALQKVKPISESKADVLFPAVRHMLPTDTYQITLDELIQILEGTGELENYALEQDMPPENGKELFKSMAQRGFLYPESAFFYENILYDYLVAFAHEVYPQDIFGKDIRGWTSTHYLERKIGSRRIFNKWYDNLKIESYIFHNLPVDGNVWDFGLRNMDQDRPPSNKIGFCYSFEKSGMHHFIPSYNLREALFNISDIRKSWIKDVSNCFKSHSLNY